jgi:peptidoglycan hydrolase-like protein with peptidoglycan-binding domain
MKRRARSRERPSTASRLAWGGGTALAIVFAFVSSNAIWYQPHGHLRPLMATRMPTTPPATQTAAVQQQEPAASVQRLSLPEEIEVPTTARAPTPPTPPMPVGEPVVAEVQQVMAELGLYKGTIDGLAGPQTDEAIRRYRKMVGLEVTGSIDDKLLSTLGTSTRALPAQRQTAAVQTAAPVPTQPVGDAPDPIVQRIQAGLRAFGNDHIDVDGRVGPNTSAAIKEFQSLFGLPVTGEVDADLHVKMTEIGLIQ